MVRQQPLESDNTDHMAGQRDPRASLDRIQMNGLRHTEDLCKSIGDEPLPTEAALRRNRLVAGELTGRVPEYESHDDAIGVHDGVAAKEVPERREYTVRHADLAWQAFVLGVLTFALSAILVFELPIIAAIVAFVGFSGSYWLHLKSRVLN